MSQPTAGTARAPAKTAPTAAAPSAAASSGTAAPVHVQEFTVRIPKNLKKMHHVMRFNATLKVDFAQWKNVKMERENNMRDARAMEEEMPKFGAGSEYNRDQKEEFRRKKFGFTPRKYKQDAQPWILKVGGKSGKKFRGIREGGVGAYASFYVFAHSPDGAIEAYPLNEWYNFQPIQRYKALSAEEAEQVFGRRNKVMNHFSLMMRHRLKGDEEGQDDPEEAKLKLSGKKAKEFKISDADDIMMDSDDDSDSDKEEKKDDDSDAESKKKKSKKQPLKKKKKKNGSDDEAFEESDDGDEEGREMDYIESSDSDESDPELQMVKEMKSVAEEDGLRKLLDSDEESEEEKNSSDESSKEEEKKKEVKDKETKDKKKSKSKKPKDGDKKESLSDLSSDSSDSEVESKKPRKLNGNSANNSRSASPSMEVLAAGPSGLKRKLPSDLGLGGNSNGASENSNSPNVTPAKKTKYDTPSVPASFAGVISSNKDDNGITEEAVRRYLMRKPMTTTELLTKFKNKKTGVTSDKLVETMTQILKKINPVKQTIQGKMYLSIKNK
ncbi:general transcription factor IIF subunit 1-like [Sitodiplosis mosellana]|uniref:general transcription factor IIF subunit 1-like n=1 Tax=Sitodiplosis mosellana TaxID=263140 RepID=UPI0024453342|nr:general transcription factor IIF subunit 1-like [Sitodiplosis mosellana]